jgi:hypothetical protein
MQFVSRKDLDSSLDQSFDFPWIGYTLFNRASAKIDDELIARTQRQVIGATLAKIGDRRDYFAPLSRVNAGFI